MASLTSTRSTTSSISDYLIEKRETVLALHAGDHHSPKVPNLPVGRGGVGMADNRLVVPRRHPNRDQDSPILRSKRESSSSVISRVQQYCYGRWELIVPEMSK